jgi:hypothetical protein
MSSAIRRIGRALSLSGYKYQLVREVTKIWTRQWDDCV